MLRGVGIVVVGDAHATLLPSSSRRECISHMDCVTQTIFAHLRSSTCWVAHHVRMSSHCHGFPNSHTLEVLQAGSRRRACQRLSLVAARAGFPPNGPESNYGGLHGGNTKGRLAALRYYQKKVPPQKNPNWIPIACAHGLAEPRHQETPPASTSGPEVGRTSQREAPDRGRSRYDVVAQLRRSAKKRSSTMMALRKAAITSPAAMENSVSRRRAESEIHSVQGAQ